MSTLGTRLNLSSIGTGEGVIIQPATAGDAAFDDLYRAALDEVLATAGHVVIRGFDTTTDQFNGLVRHYSSRITLDPARSFHGDVAQKVDSGHGPIGLHLENGTTPFAPDVIWFYAIKAARIGSETIVCDGARVWDALSYRAREMFTEQPVRYSRTVPSDLWKRLAAHLVGDGRKYDQMTVDDLYAVTNPRTEVAFSENADGSLFYEYTVFAAHPTRCSARISWANSLLGPSYNYETPEIRFANGSPIPEAIIEECAEVTASLTEELRWEDRDVVLIDNSRVMHGRRSIADPDRSILNAQCYVRG